MSTTLSIVIPSMRSMKTIAVIHDIAEQTRVPDKVVVVDNSGTFYRSRVPEGSFAFELLDFGENIGTNAVWNMMYDFDTDYVGMTGDDLRLDPNMFDKMIRVLGSKYHYKGRLAQAGAVCPTIVNRLPLPKSLLGELTAHPIKSGKGNAGVVLMKRDVLKEIPKIPKEFKLFYGDDWLSYWIRMMGLWWVIIDDCYAYHKSGHSDLSKKLSYREVLKQERVHWRKFNKEARANIAW